MAGRHFDRAGAECGVDRAVGDDRDEAVEDGQSGVPAHQVTVALVVGMNGDPGVAEHRLRSGSGDGDDLVAPLDRVGDGPEGARRVAMDDLEIGERGLAARAPGDEPLAAVDEPLVIEALEDVAHRARRTGVHGEDEARPVARGAQDLHLLADAAAVLVHELPDPLQELLAAEVVPGQPLFGQLLFDDPLAGDAGVVRARNPERGIAEHAMPADHDVFDGDEEGVADVQLAGDVRRRHDDHEWFAVRSLARLEIAGIVPAIVDAGFDQAGIIGFGK